MARAEFSTKVYLGRVHLSVKYNGQIIDYQRFACHADAESYVQKMYRFRGAGIHKLVTQS